MREGVVRFAFQDQLEFQFGGTELGRGEEGAGPEQAAAVFSG